MKVGASLSTGADSPRAAKEAAVEARRALGEETPSLAVLFVSPHHAGAADVVLGAVREAAGGARVIGCVGEAVVGGDREVEREPAVSVWMAALPGPVETFHMEFVRTTEGGVFAGWRFEKGAGGVHLLICDPFTFPADLLLRHLNEHAPGTVVMGGMASGAMGPGETRLFVDDRVVDAGAVGARLEGVELRPLVSQGCRPVGSVYAVTKAQGNVILELGGRPPLERLRELAGRLSPADRELLSRGLHIGRVIDEYKTELGPGDFLVRSVVGLDPSTGAMAVGDQFEVGETVQFHLRDAEAADQELRTMLDRELSDLGGRRPAGALLFTCNGRGSRMFASPDHDAALIARALGGLPLAGFFCAGELGPVGGKNFLHGFTASLALLLPED